jgi:hypothetical protein
MKKENKETELLSKTGKFIIRYLDYTLLFVALPVIFDVRFADVKVFIALGSLIVIRAIMPDAYDIMGWGKKEATYYPEPKPKLKVDDVPVARAEFPKKEFVPQSDIISQAIIDTTNQQLKMIRFGEGAEQINIKKTEDDCILVSFTKDFRVIRIPKGDIKRLYVALLESEYQFFQPGKWYLAITAKKQ